MKKVIGHLNRILYLLLGFFFLFCTVFSVFIKCSYNNNLDTPSFAPMPLPDYLCLAVVAAGFFLTLKYYQQLNAILDKRVIALLFLMLAAVYVWQIPLSPFSDMEQIFRLSSQFADGAFDEVSHSQYLNMCPNNLPIVLLFGSIMAIFGKNLLILKCCNVVFILMTAWLISLLVKRYEMGGDNLAFAYALSFISVFLYINHIYSDLICLFLVAAGIYIYHADSRGRVLFSVLIIALAGMIRPPCIILYIAILLDLVLKAFGGLKKYWLNFALSLAVGLLLLLFINPILSDKLLKSEVDSYPAAAFLYIGMNEERFGFMDGSLSTERTMAEVFTRLSAYGAFVTGKLIVKKVLWTWCEGTYQAERYGLNPDYTSDIRLEYDTYIAGKTAHSQQKAVRILNGLARGQYILMMGLVSAYCFRKHQDERLHFAIYAIWGFLLFYLVWEMKSRYILPLFPLMVSFSFAVLSHNQDREKWDRCRKKTLISL